MNDVYGVDPAAPANFRDFAQLMRVFEPGQGRFIADFPMEWFHDVRIHMTSLTDVQQLMALEMWLKIGRNAVVPVNVRFNSAWLWAENAVALRGHVKKVIGTSGCPATMEPLDKVLLDPSSFPDARGGHIPRTAHAYAEAARPLLQISPKIVLVDPYFKLRFVDPRSGRIFRSDRHRKSLAALLSEAARWKRVETFRLMVSDEEALKGDQDGEIFSADLEDIAQQADASGSIEIEWGVLDRSISAQRHPRYLLGMNSGLHFDWGFDTDDVNTTNHIEWMGKSVLEPLLKMFT